MKKLTIGMATFDDYDGVYFTLQAIMLYHPEVLDDIEILVIDNDSGGKCAEPLVKLCNALPVPARYRVEAGIKGTAVKGQVFEQSDTPYTLCIDCHILIQPGAIRQLIEYFDSHPDTRDILHGPLLYDNHKTLNTHFSDTWGSGMKGQWAMDERGRELEARPFEIPAMGMGLSACRTDVWPGYNPKFRGFFVEEQYVHEKFRRNGGKALCLPFLRWVHRFARPYGTKYKNSWKDRVRNYLLAYDELGMDNKEMIDHFKSHLNDPLIDSIIKDYNKEMRNVT